MVTYSCIWCLIALLILVRILQIAVLAPEIVLKSISAYIFFAIYSFTIFSSIFVAVQILFTRHKHAKIYSLIEDIDCIFATNVKVRIDYDQEAWKLLKQTLIYFVVIVAFLTGYLVSSGLTKPSLEMPLYALVSGVTNRMFCVMYINFMWIIHKRLQLLLDALQNYSAANLTNTNTIVFKKIDSICPFLRYRIDHLKMIYGKLWLLTDQLEQCFGPCLLMVMLLLCSIVTVNLYWLLITLMEITKEVSLGIGGKSDVGVWILLIVGLYYQGFFFVSLKKICA